jgi:hypothetical protein
MGRIKLSSDIGFKSRKSIKCADNSNMLDKEGDLPIGMVLGVHDMHVMSPA